MDQANQHDAPAGDSAPTAPPGRGRRLRPGCLILVAVFAILSLVASFGTGGWKYNRELVPALCTLALVQLLAAIRVVRELRARNCAPRASGGSLARRSLRLGIAASVWALLAPASIFNFFGLLGPELTWWNIVIVYAFDTPWGLIVAPGVAALGLALSVRAGRVEDSDAMAYAASLLNGLAMVVGGAWLAFYCLMNAID
ncbi:MAG TPA: hypothetical protein VGM19_05690 [Armatimonadota bacterium]|jgi:hypothetical protein